MRRFGGTAIACSAFPWPVAAHDAFGDLGPFYAHLLHPLAAPLQGLLIICAMALLVSAGARTARTGLPAFLAGAILGACALSLAHAPPQPTAHLAIASAALGVAALARCSLSIQSVVTCTFLTGLLVGAAADPPAADGDLARPLAGTLAGILLMSLLAWSAIDALRSRLPLTASLTGIVAAAVAVGLTISARA